MCIFIVRQPGGDIRREFRAYFLCFALDFTRESPVGSRGTAERTKSWLGRRATSSRRAQKWKFANSISRLSAAAPISPSSPKYAKRVKPARGAKEFLARA